MKYLLNMIFVLLVSNAQADESKLQLEDPGFADSSCDYCPLRKAGEIIFADTTAGKYNSKAVELVVVNTALDGAGKTEVYPSLTRNNDRAAVAKRMTGSEAIVGDISQFPKVIPAALLYALVFLSWCWFVANRL